MFNKIVSDVFPDLFSDPIMLLIGLGVAAVMALVIVFFGGATFIRSVSFGFEKRRCKKMLEDEEIVAFLKKVAETQKGEACKIAQKILEKSKNIDWKMINEDRDLLPIRETCEDIDILRNLKLKI